MKITAAAVEVVVVVIVEVEVAAAVVEAEVVKYNDIDSNNYLGPCKLVLAMRSFSHPQLISRTTNEL